MAQKNVVICWEKIIKKSGFLWSHMAGKMCGSYSTYGLFSLRSVSKPSSLSSCSCPSKAPCLWDKWSHPSGCRVAPWLKSPLPRQAWIVTPSLLTGSLLQKPLDFNSLKANSALNHMAETHCCILQGLKLSSSSGQTPKVMSQQVFSSTVKGKKNTCTDIPDLEFV